MKLIIDIPKKEYEDFKELIAINIGGRCSGKGIIQTCLNAVKNGTPLDENKGEWKHISPAGIYECSCCGQNVMTNDIECYKFCHGCGTRMKGGE